MLPDGPTTTRWPFSHVVDASGGATGWVVLHAPITTPSRIDLFAEHRRAGARFVGMTSFLSWPSPRHRALLDPARHPVTALDDDQVCEGWCHCFRHPDDLLPAAPPRTRLAWSDFTDPAVVDPARYADRATPGHDFLVVGADEPWKRRAKRWDLAVACATRLAEAGWRGLVVGAPAGVTSWRAGITVWPRLPQGDLFRVLAAARLLVVPSEEDPSPRLLAEALCLDVPILVNRAILGGWAYVDPATGGFFDGADDVVAAATAVVGAPVAPRRWWIANAGPDRAGRALHDLIRTIDPATPAAGAPYRLTDRLTGRLSPAPGRRG